MNRRHRVVRAWFYLSLALPFAALACGDSFTAGPGDGGAEGGIVFGDGGEGHDATTDGAGPDAQHDGGAADGATRHDGSMADGSTCPPGSIMCTDGGCAPEGPTNCGSCGNDCTTLPHVTNPQCTAGKCSFTCDPGWKNCTTNPGAGCATDTNAQGNCGGCNVTCSGNTPVCSGGTCASGCSSGQTLCSGTCVNTTNNPQDCNGCGNVCPAGPPNSQPTCANSMCSWACDSNYQACNSECIQISADPNQVFVAQGSPTTNCGSESSPCGTITAALSVVQNSVGTKNVIYVAGSSTPYAEPAPITLPAGVTIQGGWEDVGGQWSHPCPPNASRVVIEAPAGSKYVISASYNGSSTIDSLTITNNTIATPGESLYGIFEANAQASQTTLTVTNVVINVAAGGSGIPGTAGDAGAAPAPSCSPGNGINAGMNGSNGSTPTTPPAGYGLGGYAPAGGGIGGNSGDGQPGAAAPGIGADGGPQCITNAYPSSNTTDLTCCGNYGGFVLGGGCVNCTGSPTAQLCGGVGTNGCGSGGSKPGSGGGGGGASIGVYAWNVTVNLQATINTGAGGTGGAGGPGGSVSTGSLAVAGASDAYVTACNTVTSGTKAECQATSTGGPLAGGAKGQNGGTGGQGGQGGGGTGGDSYCYYAGGGANVTANVTCTPGTAGSGGSPNGPTGASGTHN
jgi:hypothetical protein